MLDSPIGAERLAEIYSRTAAFYDVVAAPHQAVAKLVALEMLARRDSERFLEVGMGTGWAFEHLLSTSPAEHAYGLEVAEGMIDVARQRLQPRDGFPALLLGDIGALPFRDAAFDCLLCTYTIECLTFEMAATGMKEMLRVLKPGGRLVVADLTQGEGADRTMTDEWQEGFGKDPEFFGGARPVQLTPLFEAAGFTGIERRYVALSEGWPSEVVLGFRPA